MRTRSSSPFLTVRVEGGLLTHDLLNAIQRGDKEVPGFSPTDYGLGARERLSDAISRSWTRLRAVWEAFSEELAALPETDASTGRTREQWLRPLFQELGYGTLEVARKAVTLQGKDYAISHRRGEHLALHLLGVGVDLDRRAKGVIGAATASPHGLLQEFLNRSDAHLWAVLTNGRRLRLLRDNESLTRQAYIEFDLERMFEGELFSDFRLLWLLAHATRLEADPPEKCWLEQWVEVSRTQGARALETLRKGVEDTIRAMGSGFLAHRGSGALRARLRSGELPRLDYYRQLLRLVYRLIFLFAAEERGLLHPSDADPAACELYRRHYSTERLRALAARLRGGRHADMWAGLRVVMGALGREGGAPEVGLPGLGGFLWSAGALPDLEAAEIANEALLEAVRALAFVEENRTLFPVSYKNLGPEELGSVYESLLELEPEIDTAAPTFELKVLAGHERKTTGSYYTPQSLIDALLDSALDPVLDRAAATEDPERAILALKVCDPAVGSGHFLIAAAHRIARALAAIRSGDSEPSPDQVRTSLRDVIGRCLYGVDLNPMALELCKVNLWLEALHPGRPLTFLDSHLQVGNSLLGTTPALLARGIPDNAYKPLVGDDEQLVSELRRDNRAERQEGQDIFTHRPAVGSAAAFPELTASALEITCLPEETVADVQAKGERYAALLASDEYRRERLRANGWCTAFLCHKTREAAPPVTTSTLRALTSPDTPVDDQTVREVERLAGESVLFHWHLAFPEVFGAADSWESSEEEATGWSGGFDVVLGNPPWERVKLAEREFFAGRNQDIVEARTAAARGQLIAHLEHEDQALYTEYLAARRLAEGVSHVARNSGRYPLTGRGDVNTYPLFAELGSTLIAETGRLGLVLPSGIATDDTTKHFFAKQVDERRLVSLYDFENRKGIFPGVHRSYKFCLLTLGGPDAMDTAGAEFAFFQLDPRELAEEEKRFRLTAQDIELVNPNTKTCPIFRTRRDAELTKAIYRRVPVLIREAHGEEPERNPWGIRIRRIFDMARDSVSFLAIRFDQIDGEDPTLVPMYEGKMFEAFNHRAAGVTYNPANPTRGAQPVRTALQQLLDPDFAPNPLYLYPAEALGPVDACQFAGRWILGYKDITAATNERSMIAAILPPVATNLSIRVVQFVEHCERDSGGLLLAVFNSFAFDYLLRQSLGGLHVSDYIAKQIPTIPPASLSDYAPWSAGTSIRSWLVPRVLELTYTASNIKPFAIDCGFDCLPFRWDDVRREMLRVELDGAFFHLYGIARDDVAHVMDSFPIVERHDQQRYGDYRTKLRILEIHDALQEAIDTGQPYRTQLDPPPADPSRCVG